MSKQITVSDDTTLQESVRQLTTASNELFVEMCKALKIPKILERLNSLIKKNN